MTSNRGDARSGGSKPRLLDLFSGAGGAAMGYSRAGFEVVGVDIKPQPNYPFEFIQEDALYVLRMPLHVRGFDAIHASPPCQLFSAYQRANKRHLTFKQLDQSVLADAIDGVNRIAFSLVVGNARKVLERRLVASDDH